MDVTRAPGVLHRQRRAAERATSVDAVALERDLRRAVEGEVRFDAGSRALYATDASNYRQPPIGVVVPKTVEDVLETVAAARRHGAPILSRGGGTSLAGQCCNVAVVIDMSKYLNRVIELDPANRRARVQPGLVLDDLRKQAARYKLTFAPDPATHSRCTLGGMLGNNSCGVHAVMAELYGAGPTTAHQVEALDVVTYDGVRLRVEATSDDERRRIVAHGGRRGEIYAALDGLRDRYAAQVRARFPDIQRRVSGYNLPALLPEHGFDVARALVGSESTCVTILEATVTLMPAREYRALLVLGYPDVFEAAAHVPELREFRPVGLEGIDDLLVEFIGKKASPLRSSHARFVGLLPPGRGWLFVEFGGDTQDEANEQARRCMAAVSRGAGAPTTALYTEREQQEHMWDVRESGLGATAFIPGQPDTWEGWEDSAVPVDHVAPYLRDLRKLYDEYGYHSALYGHFGQGCIHCRVDFDLVTPEGLRKYRRFAHDAAELVVRHGGSLSGEHGDGQSRGELLPIMFGDELMQAFREFKSIWDPDWKMNPGKLIGARPMLANLRLGADYRPWQPRTRFRYPEDGGSFAHATLRCVGVGKCRQLEGGTMCPSFMALREEKHTTRGRAHMLFEMLQGDVITDGWRSEEVKDSLDLCLACKGCKGECPVNVDVATYKAEFLSHYYAGRLRPRHAYAFGLIFWWARLAMLAPGLVNGVIGSRVLGRIAKAAMGVAAEREIPRFAAEPFTTWWRRRGPRNTDRPPVMLWPDTFNNYFYPETAKAAVEVLEAAGFRVIVPEGSFCCGRPLYDYGMLDLARRKLDQIIEGLAPEISAGIPMVGLEPSCVSVFRDEMVSLLPHDMAAKRLSAQTMLLSQFLERYAKDWTPPALERRALVHGHCHHKSILGFEEEKAILAKLRVEADTPETGCCGMAGAFGMETDKYDLSVAVGERVLLPAVRQAPRDTLIVANGFSCRNQIEDLAGRRALHLAEVIKLALAQGQRTGEAVPREIAKPSRVLVGTAAVVAAAVVAGTIWRRAA